MMGFFLSRWGIYNDPSKSGFIMDPLASASGKMRKVEQEIWWTMESPPKGPKVSPTTKKALLRGFCIQLRQSLLEAD